MNIFSIDISYDDDVFPDCRKAGCGRFPDKASSSVAGARENCTWAARGLKYLHESVQPPVCHGNITSSSVWVFDDFTAKVQYPGHMPYGAGNVAVKEVHTILQGDE